MLNWKKLVVWNEGEEMGELGEMVETAPANLDNATITDGRISEWPGFFIAAPDEEPAWDTPHIEVDWEGFVETRAHVCGWVE